MITGTPTTAGTYNVTVTARDSSSAHATGSASFTWTVTGGGGGSCSGQKLVNPGFETDRRLDRVLRRDQRRHLG